MLHFNFAHARILYILILSAQNQVKHVPCNIKTALLHSLLLQRMAAKLMDIGDGREMGLLTFKTTISTKEVDWKNQVSSQDLILHLHTLII